MTFLQPLGLALAAVAAIPILVHLLRRRVVQRVAFPALRYLRDAEQRTARSLRLRDLALLLLRVCLVLLLAVAAARPLAGRGDAGDHAPTDAILLVDNTASMGRVQDGRTLLDHQIDAARATLDHATPADRFWVVPAAGSPLAAGVDAATAGSALDAIEVTGAGTDLVRRMEEATTAVPVEDGRVREIQLYTDRQATGLRSGPLDLSAWGGVAVAAPPDAPVANRFVAETRLEPEGTAVPGDPPSLAIEVRSAPADPSVDTVDVRILVDGGTVSMVRATAGDELLVRLPDLEPGPHSVQVEIPPSGLRMDDARRIGILAAEAPVVRHAGGGDGFVAAALQTLLADGRARDAAAGPADDAVHVLEGAGAALPSGGRALILVPPAELSRLPAFQQRLDALGVPWRLIGSREAGELRLDGLDELPALGDVRIASAYRLERLAAPATPDDSVLVRTEDGLPWLVRGRVGDRTYLLVGSALDPATTDLPVSVAMVPFVERLVLHWSRPSSVAPPSVEAGTPAVLPARIEALVSPAGDTLPAEGGAPWTPLATGAWTFLLPAGPAGEPAGAARHVGVNVPTAESDLGIASEEELRAALAGTDVRPARSRTAWTDVTFQERRGAEATPWIALAIGLLAVAELLLAAPGRRRRAAKNGARA